MTNPIHSMQLGRALGPLLFLALGAALGTLVPTLSTAHAEGKAGPAGDAVWLVVTHKVEDFNRWKPAFDGSAATKAGYGWKQSTVYSIDDDRNNVMVMEQFASIERAKAFAGSPELKAAMGKAGVVGKPDIHFVRAVATSHP